MQQRPSPSPAHRSETRTNSISIEVRFFNNLARFTSSRTFSERVEVPVGTTVGDLIERFRLPLADIYLVLQNGRDITPGIFQGGVVDEAAVVEDGDAIAFSGPVPYSYTPCAPAA